jgi:hypothetical protein
MKQQRRKKFYDKNGVLIKLGDKLDIPKKDRYFYKDLIVIEEDNQLGLYFVHQDFFIPLGTLLDTFFETCEVVNKTE